MRRRPLAPPEKITASDVFRIVLGALFIPLGVVILARSVSLAFTVQGILAGSAFIAFGVYRLWTAWSRYRLYRSYRGVQSR